MTAHTDGTLADDAEVIEMLRRVATEATPPLGLNIDQVLVRGRRARSRRHSFVVPASSLAVAGIAALVFAIAQAGTGQRLLIDPLASGTEASPHSTAQGDTNRQVLQEALGDDFSSIDPEGGNPGGNVTVRPGSPSAEGLPTGLTLWTGIFALQQSPESGELSELCKPMVEKNVTFSACTARVLPDRKTVYVRESRTGPGGIKPGLYPDYLASDGVRVLFERTDGSLVIVDLSTQGSESNSTPERRAAAQAWLDGMMSRLATAATDQRVDTNCYSPHCEAKGSRATPTPSG